MRSASGIGTSPELRRGWSPKSLPKCFGQVVFNSAQMNRYDFPRHTSRTLRAGMVGDL